LAARRLGFADEPAELRSDLFRPPPPGRQFELF